MLRLYIPRRRALAAVSFALSVLSTILLACSQANASIWLVKKFDKTRTIAALAVDINELSLVVNLGDVSGSVEHLGRVYPDGSVQTIDELHHSRQLVALAQGGVVDLNLFSITRFGPGKTSARIVQTGTWGGDPVILDANHRVEISATSIAVNRGGDLFVGGYKNADVPGDGNVETYFVWQFSKDKLGQWHATTLASGPTSPRLISTNSDTVRLLDSESNFFTVTPAAKERVELLHNAAPRPAGADEFSRTIKLRPAQIAQDNDGTVVWSDSENGRIWRLTHDGKALSLVAGVTGDRDNYQTDPLQFSLSPGAIAIAREGGIFVDDGGEAIRFIGPNDKFEQFLTQTMLEAESLARDGNPKQAQQRIIALKNIAANEAKTMRGWRAQIALTTLRFRMKPETFDRVENWSVGPALTSAPAAGKKSKRKCSCFS